MVDVIISVGLVVIAFLVIKVYEKCLWYNTYNT